MKKFRDYILGQGFSYAIPEGEKGLVQVSIPNAKEMYDMALASFKKLGINTCAVPWNGVSLRASTGTPVEDLERGLLPVIYFREPSRELKEPEELGYPNDLIQKFSKIKTGLVLFCGDQGAGKTTGLSSILRRRVRMTSETAVTFEAPPEYDIAGLHEKGFINQVSLPSEQFFASAASISLRMAAPDIVAYGEIRNPTGVKEICNNAFSSHLVMTTLHSYDVPTGLQRFIDLVIAGQPDHRDYYLKMLSQSLKLCIHQKLERISGNVRLIVDFIEYSEELRSAIYQGSNSARYYEILERQRLMRRGEAPV